MTKPIHIEAVEGSGKVNFIQVQRNNWVRASSGKLVPWIIGALDKAVIAHTSEAIDTVTLTRKEAFEAVQHLITELADESNSEIDLVVKWEE